MLSSGQVLVLAVRNVDHSAEGIMSRAFLGINFDSFAVLY